MKKPLFIYRGSVMGLMMALRHAMQNEGWPESGFWNEVREAAS